jgi:hypothetical protein
VKPFEQSEHVYHFSKPEPQRPESWEQDVTELENYFAGLTAPTETVKLNRYTTITDCSLYIENQLNTLKANNGKRIFLPHLKRLYEMKLFLTKKSN